MVDDDIPRTWRRRQVITTLPVALFAFATSPALAGPLPTDGALTQGFHSGHNGIDIAAPIGTPIYSVEAGRITVAGGNDPTGFGMQVDMEGESGFVHTFGHVNAVHVSVGQWVDAGQHIADVGNRGQSTGPHVHWRVTTPEGNGMDPLAFEPLPAPEQDHPMPPIEPPPGIPGDLAAQILAMLQAAWQELLRHLPPVNPTG